MAKSPVHIWRLLGEKAVPEFTLETVGRLTLSALYIAFFVVYADLRLANVLAIEEVRQFPDTPVYTKIATLSFWNIGFWIGRRPWTVPLFYKLLGNDPYWISLFQAGLSVSCWALLAISIARAVHVRWLKLVAFAVFLVFSLSAEISMWDGIMLCDSISLSFMALFIAGWLWLLEGWDLRKAALVVTVAFFWAFAYDTNAWGVLMISVLLIIMVGIGRAQRRYLLIAALLAVIFAASDLSANRGRRWVVAFINTVGTRILPGPERTEYFARLGMPITPTLTRLAGKKAWAEDWAFFNDPALREFRDWLHARGKATYIRFLLSHPAMAIQEPLRHPEELLAPELGRYAPVGFSPMLRGALAEIVYPKKWALLWIWAAAVILGLSIGLRIWRHHIVFLVPLGMILLVYPHTALVWHGDPNEIGRHALQAGVYFRLGLWMFLFFATDVMLTHTNFFTEKFGMKRGAKSDLSF